MNIVYKKVDEIIPYEKNPRINDAAVEAVAKSIKEFGWQQPIVVDKDMVVIVGHTRLKSAKMLGLTEVPVVVAEHLTPEQVQAYRIADNKTGEIAEWDYALLPMELKDLQNADFDLSVLGFDPDELNKLLYGGTEETITEGETEPDAVPEVPEEPASVPGTVYQLGKHRLLCGDATKAEDVGRLMGDEKANLWLTDPPYNVAYEGSNGMTIENDNMEDTQFRNFLRDAFQCVHDRMEPGASFYIFHADSEGYNFRGACHAIGLKVRQCLIWKKNSLVLGRQDYQWIHEPCQPPGTIVWTEGNTRTPIEELKDGDRVMSFMRAGCEVTGYKKAGTGVPVKTASRDYNGELYGISSDGKITWTTPEHRFAIRFKSDRKDFWCTYLMKRGRLWRVGMCRIFNQQGNGLKVRLKQENADAAWVLGVFKNRPDASAAEQATAVRFGIPLTHWEPARGQLMKESWRHKKDIMKIYMRLDLEQVEKGARELLKLYHRVYEIPSMTRELCREKFSRRVITLVPACNILPEVMEIPVPYEHWDMDNNKTYSWQNIDAVKHRDYQGKVYSLDVEKHHFYIADGLLTHNCLYGWKDGAAHAWYNDRSQTTVMEYNKPKHNDVHPCLSPETMVMTRRGYVRIGEIEKGDFVLSDDGKYHEVTLVSRHPYKDSIYRIGVTGTNFVDFATHNHPYLSARRSEDGEFDICWRDAECLRKNDFILTPQLEHGFRNDISKLDAWCYGLWLAQGSLLKKKGKTYRYPVFALDDAKPHLRKKVEAWGGKANVRSYRTKGHNGVTVMVFDPAKGERCVERCGEYADRKTIAPEVFEWSRELRQEFFEGYMAGDGCLITTRGHRHSKSVSIALASQMKFIAESLGYKASLYARKAPVGTGIGDRKFKNVLPFFAVDYRSGNRSAEQREISYHGHKYWLRRVKSVESVPYDGEVVNLNVEGTHTFQTAVGMTHNTMKPVQMLVYLIKNSSKRGETVIDTFGGSGSTLIACEQTGRICRMMEFDPKYCDVIRRRWAEFTAGEGCDWQALTPAVNNGGNENE